MELSNNDIVNVLGVRPIRWAALFGLGLLLHTPCGLAQEWKSGVEWQEPPVITPGSAAGAAPSDAVILFDGSHLDQWDGGEKWLVEDGVAIPRETQISTRQHFGDLQLHLEWAAPEQIRGEGQGRGNSGVFLMGLYELQVLDSYQNSTYFDGQAASIYKQTPPMVNAMRKPGEWNTYDVIFNVPKFRVNGDLAAPGHITVLHNGIVVLNHFELLGPTSFIDAPHYTPHAEKGPISLQFHGDPVRFRNIWVRELKPPVGIRVRAPFHLEPRKPQPAPDADKTAEPAASTDSKKSDAGKSDAGKPDADKATSPKTREGEGKTEKS